ncbi:hypothetical protein [Hydrogenimonas sp.]
MKHSGSLGPCPACGEDIVARSGFYGCSGFAQGCDFTLSLHALASIGHYQISAKQMRKLLKGPTQMGFRTSSGVERIFTVELKKIDGRWRAWVDFDAGSELEVLGECPLCGGDVVETPLSYGCSRWEEGCEFAIFKNSLKRFGGKMLSKQKARKLLADGETEVVIRRFDGGERSVPLLLDTTYGCRVLFNDREGRSDPKTEERQQ